MDDAEAQRTARLPERGQPWATFLRNYASDVWACDSLPVTGRLFRPVYAFFVIALGSHRIVHIGVTRHPIDDWLVQQLREAGPFGPAQRFLIRDNDGKYGAAFSRVTAASDREGRRTAYRAPQQIATCERFLGNVQREGPDHGLILGEVHLRRTLREYIRYFNRDRPHQGLAQQPPKQPLQRPVAASGAAVCARPDFRRPPSRRCASGVTLSGWTFRP